MMMSGFSCIAENCFSMESIICRQIRKISNIYDLIANTNQISKVFYKLFYKARVATFFKYLKQAGSLQVLLTGPSQGLKIREGTIFQITILGGDNVPL